MTDEKEQIQPQQPTKKGSDQHRDRRMPASPPPMDKGINEGQVDKSFSGFPVDPPTDPPTGTPPAKDKE